MLYIVSTPIGNLKDITLRALEVLRDVHLIAAEDTRHTRILTKHHAIDTPMTSYFEHNKFKKGEHILNVLKEGKDVALVTDAGTPGISDPGYHLIRLAQQNDIPMTAIPGPTALIAGLTLSGLPCHNFVFEGFLPVKSSARQKKLTELKKEKRTLIFYESPYRLVKTLHDIKDIMNDPYVVCARELTKKFEDVQKGPCSRLMEYYHHKKPRGEIVLLLNLSNKEKHLL